MPYFLRLDYYYLSVVFPLLLLGLRTHLDIFKVSDSIGPCWRSREYRLSEPQQLFYSSRLLFKIILDLGRCFPNYYRFYNCEDLFKLFFSNIQLFFLLFLKPYKVFPS
jgi:hypothetical protein